MFIIFTETVRKAIEIISQLDTTESLFKLDEFKTELAPGFVAALLGETNKKTGVK